jgi:hypothetical protein
MKLLVLAESLYSFHRLHPALLLMPSINTMQRDVFSLSNVYFSESDDLTALTFFFENHDAFVYA